ncbi:MAG: hypothetical protein ABI910_14295 [Gemmatimonadota bacterium]
MRHAPPRRSRTAAVLLTLGGIAVGALAACGDDAESTVAPPVPASTALRTLAINGRGTILNRFSAEVAQRGSYAYTSSWGQRGNPQVNGDAIFIWNVTSNPRLVDSLIVPPLQPGVRIRQTGDLQLSDDGRLLVVPTEFEPGSLEIYDLTNPAKPTPLARFTSPSITRGVHTAKLQRFGGRLYAFLSVNSSSTHPSRLMIVDLGDPAHPTEVMHRDMGNPFIHDVYVRDGILFTALWDDGLVLWDIGGYGKGGTLANPIEIGRVIPRNGRTHNAWWFHDPRTGSKRFVFVGEEGAANLFTSSSGDLHVIDLLNPAQPEEVAFFNVPGAGAHNFTMDEAHGILYAAFYNAGVQALDVTGDLSRCTLLQKAEDGRCDLRLMGRVVATTFVDPAAPSFVWGVKFDNTSVYATDMLNGLLRIGAVTR